MWYSLLILDGLYGRRICVNMHFLLINCFGRQWLACEIQGHGFEFSSIQIFVSKNNNLSTICFKWSPDGYQIEP